MRSVALDLIGAQAARRRGSRVRHPQDPGGASIHDASALQELVEPAQARAQRVDRHRAATATVVAMGCARRAEEGRDVIGLDGANGIEPTRTSPLREPCDVPLVLRNCVRRAAVSLEPDEEPSEGGGDARRLELD